MFDFFWRSFRIMQVSPDYRQTAARCAFFVGLQGGSGANTSAVPTALHDQLQRSNENYL
ncbi:hypothetical protein BKA82DRAFT_4207271, partial [Pisolithus tinctorius]